MRLKAVLLLLGLALFGAGVAWQVSEALHRLPNVDISALVTPMRVMTPLPPGYTPSATRPFSLSFEELMAIQNLPSSLEEAIRRSMSVTPGSLGSGLANRQDFEIVRAFRTSKRPFNPHLPYPNDLYCITVYPEVGITLYVQDYVPRPDRIGINSADDYEPGATQRGRIDHFVAIQRERSGGWELYHPEVYPWQRLCS